MCKKGKVEAHSQRRAEEERDGLICQIPTQSRKRQSIRTQLFKWQELNFWKRSAQQNDAAVEVTKNYKK